MQQGKFDRIEGQGQPLEIEPAPAEENARLLWWALRILRKNDVIPEEIKWRKHIDTLKSQLDAASEEARVRALVNSINQLVHKLNTLGTNAMKADISPMDLELELERFRKRQSR